MKKILRYACILSVLIYAVSLTLPVVGGTGGSSKSSLSALEAELADATARREAAEAALSGAEASYTDALSKKQAIDAKIYTLDAEIAALENLIDGINSEIAAKDRRISEETEKLDKQYGIILERMRAKHEDGGADLLSIIFEADGLESLFTSIDRYMSMLEYDSTLMDSYRAGIAELEQLRGELEISYKMVNLQKLNLEERMNELEEDLAKASSVVSAAENDVSTAEDTLKKVAQAELDYSNKREEILADYQSTTNAKLAEGDFIWPLSVRPKKVSSGFGWRTHPVTGKQQHHNGIDIPAPYGTEVMAVQDGTVVECSYNSADGYFITISHGGGVASFYSHLSRQRVAVGDTVKKGQVIGNVGTSGYTTGAHLNLNMYQNNVAVNPNKFLSW